MRLRDIRYAYYGDVDPCQIGFQTGIGIGYGMTRTQGILHEQFTNTDLPKLNILCGIEVGYDWFFRRGSVGICAFADIAVWHTEKDVKRQLVEVGAINNPSYPVALVNVLPLSSVLPEQRYVAFGLRLHYAFCFGKQMTNSYRRTYNSRSGLHR